MSLKPGIGFEYVQKYWSDWKAIGGLVVAGKKQSFPKYYYKTLLDKDFDWFEHFQHENSQRARESGDNDPARLPVLEQVAKARLSFKVRSL